MMVVFYDVHKIKKQHRFKCYETIVISIKIIGFHYALDIQLFSTTLNHFKPLNNYYYSYISNNFVTVFQFRIVAVTLSFFSMYF